LIKKCSNLFLCVLLCHHVITTSCAILTEFLPSTANKVNRVLYLPHSCSYVIMASYAIFAVFLLSILDMISHAVFLLRFRCHNDFMIDFMIDCCLSTIDIWYGTLYSIFITLLSSYMLLETKFNEEAAD